LRGRESMAVTWTFRPRTVGEYHNKCAVLIGGLESQVVDAMNQQMSTRTTFSGR